MKYQPDNDVMSSFELWFNDHLVRNGEAFTTLSGNLSLSNDNSITDTSGISYQPWILPNSQWAYDGSISGVTVPSGAAVNGNYSSSVKIDTQNGRVWVPTFLNPNVVSINVSSKDFEVRVSSATEESILFGDNPSQKFGSTETAVDDEVGFPFVYLKYLPGKSQGLGFGGFQITKFQIRAVTVADNSYLFDGINMLFRDTSEMYFPILNAWELPFDEYGSLRIPNFNYRETVTSDPNRLIYYIKEVTISPFSEEVNSKIAKNALGGFIDFRIESLGYPHARFV